jgi:thiol:disulfide interchange protein DsbD
LAALLLAAGGIAFAGVELSRGTIEGDTGSRAATAPGWQSWSPEAVDAALARGEPVFVDFTAAWCITCQVNKKLVLERGDIDTLFAAHSVHRLRADWTRRDQRITEALATLGRNGVPVYVLYRPEQAPLVLPEVLTASALTAAVTATPAR